MWGINLVINAPMKENFEMKDFVFSLTEDILRLSDVST